MFQGRGGLLGLGHFYKYFVKNIRKKDPTGKNLEVFSLGHSQGIFYKIRPPPPSLPPSPLLGCAPVGVLTIIRFTQILFRVYRIGVI